MENSNKGTLKWIIGLCIVTVVAIVGWTTTANLATQMRAFDEIRGTVSNTTANVAANNIRISVLENKYDMITAQLAEIKALLTTHMGIK
jgi:ascorbate-specific PTS system EIIC-type component UlaA